MRAFLIVLVGVWLWGYDYEACKRYYKVASKPVGQSRAVLVEYQDKKHYIGFFPQRPKGVKILKADPFVGLYLFDLPTQEMQSYMIMPLDQRAMEMNMADIGKNYAEKGIVLEAQKGFLQYARFTASTRINSVISNICYQIYGLGVGENLFIDSKYLTRFLQQEKPYYGEIGIRLYPPSPSHSSLRVEFVNPFFPDVPFLKDDEIISINQKTLKDYYEFEWYVSNLKENSLVRVKVKRGENILDFTLKVLPRYGGFLLPDRFFERIGIDLDDHLMITSVNPDLHSLQQGLLVGDTILWINNKKILLEGTASSKEVGRRLRELLTEAVGLGRLDVLISRGGFQFSLNLVNGLNNEYIQSRYNPFGF